MWRHHAAIAAHRGTRFHGVKAPFTGFKIGDDTAPTAEPVLDVAFAFRMRINTFAIGLPGLKQHIFDRRADAVNNHAFNANALAFGIWACDIPAQLLLIDVKASGPRGQTDMDVRTRRLGWGFLQILRSVRGHINCPPDGFQTGSNDGHAARCQNDSIGCPAGWSRFHRASPPAYQPHAHQGWF